MELLDELGIPQPVILYPFASSTYRNDYGLFSLHLSPDGRICSQSMTDRYNFVNHVTRFKRDAKHCPNQRLFLNDMSPVNDMINNNEAFSVLVHLQRYSDDFMRNGTVFMFHDDTSPSSSKFYLKETPTGSLAIR